MDFEFFHDAFAASSGDQICVKYFWTEIYPGFAESSSVKKNTLPIMDISMSAL